MKVFMLGWEFPPHISGGLGTACYGLTKGLDEIGVEVSFVLPVAIPVGAESHVKLQSPALLPPSGADEGNADEVPAFEHVEFHQVSAVLRPYARPQSCERPADEPRAPQMLGAPPASEGFAEAGAPPGEMPAGTFESQGAVTYDGDLMGQVYKYARLSVELASRQQFDVIHAHDWMTFPAAQAVAAASGRPLLVHVHSTEFDRAGQRLNQQIYEIERTGMHAAHRVICVSYLTRSIVLERYGVPLKKVRVVYNAVHAADNGAADAKPIGAGDKIVLFLGRLTMQKGPEYFLRAAKKVVEKFKDVRFVVAGSGDMISQCVREVADLKLGRYVTFTGFLRGDDVARIFKLADLYVMPSVSEPFGIAPLEAISHDVPVIISKQSGVSEVLTHVLKVDFWDIDEMANKILAVLRHPPLQKTLRRHGHIEVQKLSWRDSAKKVRDLYAEAIAQA